MEQFDTMRKSNLYEEAAKKIEDLILNDELQCGQKLPSEKKMAEAFGVSRNILREAVKILKERGLVDIRNGDGVYITKPPSAIFKRMLNRILILSDVQLRDVFEIRLALEARICEIVAQKATDDDIKQLEDIFDLMHENYKCEAILPQLDIKFHLTLASLTGNPLFISYIEPLSDYLINLFSVTARVPTFKDLGEVYHYRIIQAIKAHDPKRAKEAITDHLEKYQDKLNEYNS